MATTTTKALSAPVVEVTLLEDRARVVRRGAVDIGAGATRLTVAGVSPLVVDKTLAAHTDGVEGARVADVRIKREATPHALGGGEAAAQDRARLALEAERRGLEARLRRLKAKQQRATERAERVEQLARMMLTELAEDVAWSPGPAAGITKRIAAAVNETIDFAGWEKRYAATCDSEREARAAIVEAGFEVTELEEELTRLTRRLASTDTPNAKETAQLELVATATAPGRLAVTIEYLVPSACWRPYHTATLRDGRVTVRTDGCVWQNTGEDWANVKLSFSTRRPSLGSNPPELDSDVLSVRARSETVAVSARDQAVKTTGLGGEPPAAPELPGIDDAGEAVTLPAASKASTVPSDGRPYRVILGSFESDAEVALVARPELAEAALLESEQDNLGGRPILAGPCDLVRDSGLVGRTSLLYVAPGERFAIGWGPDSEVRIKRELEERREGPRALSSWEEITRTVKVRLSNLGTTAKRLKVEERVPVSEIDKVKVAVERRETTGQREPDADGFVIWPVELAAASQETLTLRYELRKHTDVVGV